MGSPAPGHPADYGYPEHENPKDPYKRAGVGPGVPVYDARNDVILCPDNLTATLPGQQATTPK